MSNRKLIYKFQKKDSRDYIFKASLENPKSFNLRVINSITQNNVTTTTKTILASVFIIPNLPKIINQGHIGACVANAFCYNLMQQTKNTIFLSRLFLYANCRILDFMPLNKDCGTYVRTACAALKKYGTCIEKVYPYKFRKVSDMPKLEAYSNSKKFQKFNYNFIIQDLTSIKSCLHTYKVPIIFGLQIYPSFMTETVTKTGIVPMPNISEEKLLGGHCACIVGYNDKTQMFTCANWWGTSWGNNGYFYLPYNYVIDSSLAGDFCFTNFVY